MGWTSSTKSSKIKAIASIPLYKKSNEVQLNTEWEYLRNSRRDKDDESFYTTSYLHILKPNGCEDYRCRTTIIYLPTYLSTHLRTRYHQDFCTLLPSPKQRLYCSAGATFFFRCCVSRTTLYNLYLDICYNR